MHVSKQIPPASRDFPFQRYGRKNVAGVKGELKTIGIRSGIDILMPAEMAKDTWDDVSNMALSFSTRLVGQLLWFVKRAMSEFRMSNTQAQQRYAITCEYSRL